MIKLFAYTTNKRKWGEEEQKVNSLTCIKIIGSLCLLGGSIALHKETIGSTNLLKCQTPECLKIIEQNEIKADNPWVTIFIHGTLGLERLMNLETILTLLKRSIDGSRYQRLMEALRLHPYAYSAQAAQLPGLLPISITAEPKNSVQLFAVLYEIMQNRYFPKQQNIELLTFGWSGAVNHLQRLHDAHELYQALNKYIVKKKKKYPNLKLRIISYSHGSNVVLNLEHWRQQSENPPEFSIDELILLGTPVIQETEQYIYSPLFKKIYSFYSRHDMASIVDLFSTRGMPPRRRFHKNKTGFPSNFKQIEIELTLTAKNNLHQPNNSERTIEKSPGHLEMWLFGWPDITIFYRRHFPLTPLPAVLLLPAIIEHYQTQPTEEHDQVFCYKTDEGYAYTRRRFSREKKYFNFIEPSFITSLQSYAWNFWHNQIVQTEKDAIQIRCNGILKHLLC